MTPKAPLTVIFVRSDPQAPPPSSPPSWICFQLWQLCSSKAFLGPANAIRARNWDVKYNRGRRSRKSYRAGMNSFPLWVGSVFVQFMALSELLTRELSLEGSAECVARWPHLREPNTCSCSCRFLPPALSLHRIIHIYFDPLVWLVLVFAKLSQQV